MVMVRIAVIGAVLLQLYFTFTCGIWWIASAEGDHLFSRSGADENLLDVLALAKVFVGPVSIVLLAAKPDFGKLFTGIAFQIYAVGSFVMPFLAGDDNPMAWWPNAWAAGEGPLMALIFLVVGLVLAFHKQLIRSLAEPPPPASG